MPSEFKLTRIAPTPSGFLHLGNALSFLITQRLAKKFRADLLLRIDDMDSLRIRQEYLDDIFETLDFLQITIDKGPRSTDEVHDFSQRSRLALYESYLDRLASSGMVYACNCSRAQIEKSGVHDPACREKNLPLSAPDVCWRLDCNGSKGIAINELFSDKVRELALPETMRDFIVRKRDGQPSYQLCSLADDVHFGVDLVIRGEDLFESTLAQLFLARQLELPEFYSGAVFFHHPLLKDREGRKLSKSAGDTSIRLLRERGKTREEIIGMLEPLLSQSCGKQ